MLESLSVGDVMSMPKVPDLSKIKIEPWMRDFVRERHSKEEWEAFFAYCELSPFKRCMSRMAGILLEILPR